MLAYVGISRQLKYNPYTSLQIMSQSIYQKKLAEQMPTQDKTEKLEN